MWLIANAQAAVAEAQRAHEVAKEAVAEAAAAQESADDEPEPEKVAPDEPWSL